MFGTATPGGNYCDRCGRNCRCSTVAAIQVYSAIALPDPLFLKVRLWMWEAAHGPDPIPVVHADQGVPSQRWREYQRRP